MTWTWIVIFAFVAGSVALFVVLYRRRAKCRRAVIHSEPLLPTDIREKTHELKNEATKLRMVTRRISRQDDPIGALLQAMTGHGNGRDH